MKNPIFILFLIVFTTNANAQKTDNGIYFQLFGNGILSSINYERTVLKKPLLKFHAGLGLYGISTPKITVPFGIHYLLPIDKNNFIELGAGLTYVNTDAKLYVTVDRKHNYPSYQQSICFVPSVNLRFQLGKTNLVKVGFNPVFTRYGIVPSAGLAFGKLF